MTRKNSSEKHATDDSNESRSISRPQGHHQLNVVGETRGHVARPPMPPFNGGNVYRGLAIDVYRELVSIFVKSW